MKMDANGMLLYTGMGKCGKEIKYFLSKNTGTIAIANNPECAMHYMQGCRFCAWVKREQDNASDVASVEYHSR
jgi:hypothetical protein